MMLQVHFFLVVGIVMLGCLPADSKSEHVRQNGVDLLYPLADTLHIWGGLPFMALLLSADQSESPSQ